MRPIGGPELERIQATQDDAMFDECTVDVYSETIDSMGGIVRLWVSGITISCGVKMEKGDERINDQSLETVDNVTVRLPLDTGITNDDRLTIRGRNGIVLSGVQYSVKNIRTGPSCKVVDVQRLDI